MPRNLCVEELSSGSCGKEAVEGSDRCILHHPRLWEDSPELVKEEIRHRIENGDTNFEKCHIPRMSFSKVAKGANFEHAHFHGRTRFVGLSLEEASFTGTEFLGDTFFSESEFTGQAYFVGATFAGPAFFEKVKFSDDTWFSGATFKGVTSFKQARFLGRAYFDDTYFFHLASFEEIEFFNEVWFTAREFSSIARFNKSRFLGPLYFDQTTFSSFTFFQRVKFSGDTSFERTRFLGDTRFNESDFAEVSFKDAKFFAYIDFTGTRFHGTANFSELDLSTNNFDFQSAVFSGHLAIDELKWAKNRFHLNCEKLDLDHAASSYHAIRKISLETGHYRMAGELFYNEMMCRKKVCSASKILYEMIKRLPPKARKLEDSIPCRVRNFISICLRTGKDLSKRYPAESLWKEIVDWVWTWIFYLTCGFGERPIRVLASSIAVIGGFALAYASLVDAVVLPLERLRIGLYTSLQTFTLLGSSEVALPSIGEWLMLLQAVLGATMISLFLVVFVRKMARD